MTAISDTHRLVERWREAGIPAEQAGKMVDALNAELRDSVVTKHDLRIAVSDLKIWTGGIAAASVAIIAAIVKVL